MLFTAQQRHECAAPTNGWDGGILLSTVLMKEWYSIPGCGLQSV